LPCWYITIGAGHGQREHEVEALAVDHARHAALVAREERAVAPDWRIEGAPHQGRDAPAAGLDGGDLVADAGRDDVLAQRQDVVGEVFERAGGEPHGEGHVLARDGDR
jgi:hypothetical protein